MLPITAVILCKNEEKRIAHAVKSLSSVVKKLVIQDSFSTDHSREVAEKSWSQSRSLEDFIWIARSWNGFVEARNHSLSWIETEWVLWLDADEELSVEAAQELSTHLTNNEIHGMAFPRKNHFMNKWIRFGGWYPDYKIRLCRKNKVSWKGWRGGQVHEDVEMDHSKVKYLKNPLIHHTFMSFEEQKETNQRYSTLLAQAWAERLRAAHKKSPSIFLLYIKPFIKFIENYIFKLGILDGYLGLRIALGSAQSMYWRVEKTRKLMQ